MSHSDNPDCIDCREPRALTPTTTAGRALLDAIATNERLSPSGLRMAEYRQAAAAIEREAAQQERERIRDAANRRLVEGDTALALTDFDAILAEPSDD